MTSQRVGAAARIQEGGIAEHEPGKSLKILSLLFLVLASINLTGLSVLALSRSRFEEIQAGIASGQQYLMNSWLAEYLVRPSALVLFLAVFVFLVVKERLISEVSRRLVWNAGAWVASGALFFFVLNGLYSF